MRIRRALSILLPTLLLPLATPAGASVAGMLDLVLDPCEIDRVGEARCGVARVPEDHTATGGRMIGLRVVVLPATGGDPLPDPLVFLSGGPGAASTESAGFQAMAYERLRDRRDLVFIDQRGTGAGHPLGCPPLGNPDRAQTWLGDLFDPDRIRTCLDGLGDRVDPRFYTTTATVADLEIVRRGLGYERVNLEGSSYGARVALEYIRRHPDVVRAAVLLGGSPAAMSMPAAFAADNERALEAMFADCRRAAVCHAAYPELREDLAAVVAGAPYAASLKVVEGEAREQVTLTRRTLVDGIRRELYSVDGAARLPGLIHRAASGDVEALVARVHDGRRPLGGSLSLGLYLSVTCAEDVPFIDLASARASARGTLLAEDRLSAQVRACEIWPAGTPPSDFRDPVRADTPALVINGALDPVAPARAGRAIVEHLPRARFVVAEATSHAMFRAWADCLGPMAVAFLEAGDAGGLDTACAAALERPPFETGEPAQDEDRLLTLEDIRAVREPASPRLSPDGEWVVFTRAEPESAGGGSNLWVADAAGSGPAIRLTRGAFRDGSPQWLPDGSAVTFLSDREEGRQLWRIDPPAAAGGSVPAPVRLSGVEGRILDYAWSPAGGVVALLMSIDGGGQHIDLLDTGTSSVSRLTAEAVHGIAFDWSPDGSAIAFSSQADAGFYGAFESDVRRIDVATGRVTPLVERPGLDRLPRWSPDGSRIAFLSNYGAIGGGLLPNVGVALVDAEGARVRDVGAGYDRGGFFEGPTRIEWAPDGRSVFTNVSHGTAARIVRLDVETGAAAPFTDGPLTYDAPDVAAAADRLVFAASAYGVPAEIFTTPLDRFAPVQVTEASHGLDAVAFPTAEVIEWPAPDGRTIHGLLVKPPDFDPSRRYPMITILHGGPASSVGEGFWGMGFYNPYRDDLLAARGYVVFQPNPRGSGGFGEEFRRAAAGDWGRGPLADVLSGLDHVVGMGFVDPDRLGVAGWSYGGYLTAWAIGQTDRFAAASVGAGVFDLESHFGQAREQMLEYFGGPPWEIPEAYERDSPSSFVASIVTPTQVIHGDADWAVSFAQAEQLVASLATIEVPYEFLTYPDQGHTITDAEMQDDAWKRVLAWFDRWLRDDETRR